MTRTERRSGDDARSPRSTFIVFASAALVIAGLVWAAGATNQPSAEHVSNTATASQQAVATPTSSSAGTDEPTEAKSGGSDTPDETVDGNADLVGGLPALSPQPFDSTVEAPSSLTWSAGAPSELDGLAAQPGEVAGPAVAITVTVTNPTDVEQVLTSTVVNLLAGEDETPGIQLTGRPSTRLPTVLAPDAATEATFVFNVPEDQRDVLKLTIDDGSGRPMVLFAGAM